MVQNFRQSTTYPYHLSLLTYNVAFVVSGNELSGNGVGAHVLAEQYGKDLIYLKKIINELYKGSQFKPSLVAPGGFFDREWFAKLLQTSGSSILDTMSHHMYNLGAGELG